MAAACNIAYITKILPKVVVLGCINLLPPYREMTRTKSLRYIPIF